VLIQLVGRKRVYVYPNTPPFITPHQLEDIAIFSYELDLPYQSWFDDHAKVFDIGPGEMLSWRSTRRIAWRISIVSASR
jgi:hypothetical protein